MTSILHAAVYIAAGLVFLVVAVAALRHRASRTITATSLAVVALGGVWWSLADGIAYLGRDPLPGIATIVAFPGIAVTVAAFAFLGRSANGTGWAPSRRLMLGLGIEPVVVTIVAATNPWHLAFYSGPGTDTFSTPNLWVHEPLFWVHAAYSYVLIVAAMIMLARGWWRSPPVFRRQRRSLLIGSMFPVLVNVVNLTGAFGSFGDPTPIGFAVTGAFMGYAIFRQDFIAFAPVAREVLIERISDAVIALSPDHRVIDLNPAATALLRAITPTAPPVLVGLPAVAVMGPWANALDVHIRTSDGEPVQLTVSVHGRETDLEVRASPLADGRGHEIGTVLVARDVTEVNAQRRRLEEQLVTIEALRSDLAEQANRDALTNLHNRRHLMAQFGPLLAAAEESDAPLGVVLADLDLFKQVNDRYGHMAGDAVLVAMAERLRQVTPEGAVVVRWGGEEFVIVLPGADSAAAARVAEELRRQCDVGPLTIGTVSYRCTVSVGVAAYPACGRTVDELLEAADRALYAAKELGRNRVQVSTAVGAPPTVTARPDAVPT